MGSRIKLQIISVSVGLLLGASVQAEVGQEHRLRYDLGTAQEKLVDNQGNGFEPLYGTRNVRAVLSGVFYRGGANNRYHRSNRRSNTNPLPGDGLQNLCEEGFTTAIYLYTTNYQSAPRMVTCRMNDGSTNHLQYQQLSILSANNEQIHSVLTQILSHVREPQRGPLYAHCWNGWHASGTIASYALRQFCGFSAEQAVTYWNANTDGNNDSSYEGIRRKIRSFVPFNDLFLTASEKTALCPENQTFAF